MQLLTPAHLVLALWLLTAAAPVAAVLINGSMLPAGATAAECRADFSNAERRTSNVERRAKPHAESKPRLGFENAASDAPPQAAVLHTAVQRHRPKAA